MTKAEFTPVANAPESNIDAALARIRELEARIDEQNIRANERVADALKDRADMIDRAVAAEKRLAEAEAVIAKGADAMEGLLKRAQKAELAFKVRCQQADERDSEISDQFTLVANAERDARIRAEKAEAENARLRGALEMVLKDWRFDSGDTIEGTTSWLQAQAALSPEQPVIKQNAENAE